MALQNYTVINGVLLKERTIKDCYKSTILCLSLEIVNITRRECHIIMDNE